MMRAFDLIDPNLRVQYEEAQQFAPAIVESESPFDLFLRSENKNESRAASKLATYWKYRKELFGSRAFQSILDLSGNGTLDNDDISVLRMGCVVILPDDDKGRKVVCFDDLRCHCTSESIRMHCWFYLLAVASIEKTSNPEQELVIILIRDSNRQFDYERFFIMINDAIPMKVCSIHCCYLQSEEDSFDSYVSYLSTFLRQIFKNTNDSFVSIHTKIENQDLCIQLQEHGLQKKNLPTTLGGSWLYLSFQADIDKTSEKHKNIKKLNSGTAEKPISDERRIKKRKTDVVYARKRRRKDKLLEMSLKQQCLTLAQNNDALRQEYADLLQVMTAAKNIVCRVEANKIANFSNTLSQQVADRSRGSLPIAATTFPNFNLSRYNLASPVLSSEYLNNNLQTMLAEQRQSNDWNRLVAQQNQQHQNNYGNEKLQQLYLQSYLSNVPSNKVTADAHSGHVVRNPTHLELSRSQLAAVLNQQQLADHRPQRNVVDDAQLNLQQQLRLMGQNQQLLQPAPVLSNATTTLQSQNPPYLVPNSQQQQMQISHYSDLQQRLNQELRNDIIAGNNDGGYPQNIPRFLL
jgi:hypothetical protein